MTWRWFFSSAIRQATELRKHVLKMLSAQRDILQPQAIDAIQTAADKLRVAIQSGAEKPALQAGVKQLEDTANKWLIPYPNAAWRENVEVFLVAVTIALAIRTFFLQPMKIPTGSMQPTLYGITFEDLRAKPDFKIPTGLSRWYESWFLGTSYYHEVAREDGRLSITDRSPRMVAPLVTQQRFTVGGAPYTVWFPGDNFWGMAGLTDGKSFHKGEDIFKLKIVAGDHLFVNRLTYNFRHPQRGEIVIFETKGIDGLAQDTFYIKRLVAVGGDTVKIGDDQHLVLNGQRLDAATPHFESVYTFDSTPKAYHYFGHVNNQTFMKYAGRSLGVLPEFEDSKGQYRVRPGHFMVMGDNTMNSYDSRCWGDFPREKVIGKSSFVYWPISSRFGWGQD
jgi:signal peptidase I